MEWIPPQMQKYHDLLKAILPKKLRINKEHLNQKIREIADREGTAPLGIICSYLDFAFISEHKDASTMFDKYFKEHLENEKWWPMFAYFSLKSEGLVDLVELNIIEDHRKGSPLLGKTTKLKWVKEMYINAQYDDHLMLLGKTGTSKDRLARCLHYMSKRRNEPFIAVNCSAIHKDLFEAELFGYKKGAFTGAVADKAGLFESANKGTIFLDEIGKMDRYHYAKLLRVVEDKKVRRLGDTREVDTDVRIIAAAQPGEEKEILADLRFRLGFPGAIHLPTLKERLTLVPKTILNSAMNEARKELKEDKEFELNEDARQFLLQREYEGNYRELINILKIAIKSAKVQDRETLYKEDFQRGAPLKALIQEFLTSPNDSSVETKSLEQIPLKDIVEYANDIKKNIVREKIIQTRQREKNIRRVLVQEEGLPNRKYQNFMKKLRHAAEVKSLDELS